LVQAATPFNRTLKKGKFAEMNFVQLKINLKQVHNMNKAIMFLGTLIVMCLNALSQTKSDKEEWVQLFNGKDLTGWDIKITGYGLNDNYANTSRVENGLLKVSYDQYDSFSNRYVWRSVFSAVISSRDHKYFS
jgi:hypothetical protein